MSCLRHPVPRAICRNRRPAAVRSAFRQNGVDVGAEGGEVSGLPVVEVLLVAQPVDCTIVALPGFRDALAGDATWPGKSGRRLHGGRGRLSSCAPVSRRPWRNLLRDTGQRQACRGNRSSSGPLGRGASTSAFDRWPSPFDSALASLWIKRPQCTTNHAWSPRSSGFRASLASMSAMMLSNKPGTLSAASGCGPKSTSNRGSGGNTGLAGSASGYAGASQSRPILERWRRIARRSQMCTAGPSWVVNTRREPSGLNVAACTAQLIRGLEFGQGATGFALDQTNGPIGVDNRHLPAVG